MKVTAEFEKNTVKRKSKFFMRISVTGGILIAISFLSFFGYKFFTRYLIGGDTFSAMYSQWSKGDYKAVFDTTSAILEKKQFNNTALMYHGYSAFRLSLSASDTEAAQSYLDTAVNSLRLAIISAKSKTLPQLEYMLGKAYFYKDYISSYYYYADLAVNYLLKAKQDGYKADKNAIDDIPELLGLSYASLGLPMESISAFTEALLVRESDLLLLSIAEQYYAAGQHSAGLQYLYRISQDCKDEKILMKSHLLMGKIDIEQEKFEDAQKEFEIILQKNENSADAHYGLGIIYEKQGDLVKARSEWRSTLRIQPNHADALKKIAEYK